MSPFWWRVYHEISEKDVAFMAGSIAYTAFASLLPLLVVVFVLVAALGGEALAADVLAYTESYIPPSGRRLLERAIVGFIQATSTSIIGVAMLLWAGLGLFKGLDTAFSTIFGTRAANSLVDQTRDVLVAFVVLLAAVTAAVAAGHSSVDEVDDPGRSR